ncbi:MAG: hypothetical protein ACLFRV_04090 [Acidimicrobiales bacterium]
MKLRRRRQALSFDDAGQVAGIEVLPFGFLVFVAGALLLANAWAVVDAKLAVTATARETARAFVEADDAIAAERAAARAARESIRGHGHDPAGLMLRIENPRGFVRCARIDAEAALAVSSINLPFIGGFGRTFDVRASHSEVVDPYRSGLDGEVRCD